MALMLYDVTIEGQELPIYLNLISTEGIVQEVISDGPISLYSRWEFNVIAEVTAQHENIYGSEGLLQDPITGLPAVPDFYEGDYTDSPAAKYKLISKALCHHRGKLYYWDDDGRLILTSPRDGDDIDDKGGPFVRYFNIIKMVGTETIRVHWKVETFLSVCQDPPVILSHRFRQWTDMDSQHLVTRTTQGWATFSMAKLDELGKFPDDYRHAFIHPLPTGFRREHVRITATEDGDGLEYVVLDKQVPLSHTTYATKITARQTVGLHQTGINAAHYAQAAAIALGAAERAARAVQEATEFDVVSAGTSFVASAISVASITAHAALQVGQLKISTLPTYFSTIEITVEGNEDSLRSRLESIAMSIMTTRLKPFVAGSNFLGNLSGIAGVVGGVIGGAATVVGGIIGSALGPVGWRPDYQIQITHDLMNKIVHLIATVTHTAASGAVTGYVDILSLPDKLRMTDELVTHPTNTTIILINNQRADMLQPPYSSGTRGTWVGSIIAEWIQSACNPPAKMATYFDPVSLRARAAQTSGATEPVNSNTMQAAPTQSQFESGGPGMFVDVSAHEINPDSLPGQ